MSQEIINNALQKTLFSPMTHDSLWSQFLEVMSYEISNMRDDYSLIKNNWDIYKNDKNNIIRIANSFGYDPNLTLDNTIFMGKRETESIPYRIKNKTTYNGYYLILKQNDLLGDIFNYYYNGYKLIKAVDYEETKLNLNNSNHYSPFLGVAPIKNFSTIMDSDIIILDYLDKDGNPKYDFPEAEEGKRGRWFYLDQKIDSSYWKLDTQYIKIPSNHLGIEYFPQIYYCSYITSLGVGEEDKNIYELNLSSCHIINELIEIKINHITLPTTITVDGDKEYFQDENGILNEADSYFDFTSNKIHLNFNDIPIGCEISIDYKINLLMTKEYFFYFEHGMEYNRSCPIIPHSGIFLTAEIASNRGSDFFYENNEGYSVPDLKLKAITASALNRYITITDKSFLDYAKDEYGQPSGHENYKLDSTIKWFLDSQSEQKIPLIHKFKYIACGNKALNVINEKNSQLFNLNKLIFYYNLNTDDDSSIINDISQNSLNCIVIGDKIKINGILDKSLNFNGETYAYSQSTLSMESSTDYTFGIWFNCNSEPSNNIESIFNGFINIEYDYENEKLIIDSTQFDCPKNTDCFLILIFNSSLSKTFVYLNSILIGELNFTVPTTSLTVYIGTNESHTSNFYGLIDNLWLISKILSAEEINYIYNDKISLISHMGNTISRYELYDDEKHEDKNYMLIQSYVKGMDITNEQTKFEENNSSSYDYQTKFYPISPAYFTMSFTDNMENIINLKSNEKGQFYNTDTNELVTGNIDFNKGTWTLAKSTIKSKSQEKIQSPEEIYHSSAWNRIIEQPSSNQWFELYEASTDSFGGEFIVDNYTTTIDYDEATIDYMLFIYTEDNDSEPKTKIFTQDNSQYYVTSNGNPNNQQINIGAFIINSDNSNTHLFSSDDGKTLYHKIDDMITEHNKLKAYIDLGESSNTIIYSTNNGTNMYLDVKCQTEVMKWKKNGSNEYGYSLLSSGDIIYSNLSFNNIISNTSDDWSICLFNPMEQIIKSTQINLELTLIESRTKYLNLKTIKYITSTDTDVANYRNLIPNTITLNYWIEENDVLVKHTAVINENGEVSGVNIQSGTFNYETDHLNITYDSPIKSDILISYNYLYNLELNTNKPVIMNYKLEKSLCVNEIGLEDENHELMTYMTFPDVKFNDIYNNISAMFAIIKN